MAPPKLSPEALRLLKIIFDRTTVGGSELMRHAQLKLPSELLAPIRELRDMDLIESSGDISSESTVLFASFGTRPSSRQYVASVLKQQQL